MTKDDADDAPLTAAEIDALTDAQLDRLSFAGDAADPGVEVADADRVSSAGWALTGRNTIAVSRKWDRGVQVAAAKMKRERHDAGEFTRAEIDEIKRRCAATRGKDHERLQDVAAEIRARKFPAAPPVPPQPETRPEPEAWSDEEIDAIIRACRRAHEADARKIAVPERDAVRRFLDGYRMVLDPADWGIVDAMAVARRPPAPVAPQRVGVAEALWTMRAAEDALARQLVPLHERLQRARAAVQALAAEAALLRAEVTRLHGERKAATTDRDLAQLAARQERELRESCEKALAERDADLARRDAPPSYPPWFAKALGEAITADRAASMKVGDLFRVTALREGGMEFAIERVNPDGIGSTDEHATPEMVALRKGGAVCIDNDCDLSGGYAHAGPCEPCNCGRRHAIAECPGTPAPAAPETREQAIEACARAGLEAIRQHFPDAAFEDDPHNWIGGAESVIASNYDVGIGGQRWDFRAGVLAEARRHPILADSPALARAVDPETREQAHAAGRDWIINDHNLDECRRSNGPRGCDWCFNFGEFIARAVEEPAPAPTTPEPRWCTCGDELQGDDIKCGNCRAMMGDGTGTGEVMTLTEWTADRGGQHRKIPGEKWHVADAMVGNWSVQTLTPAGKIRVLASGNEETTQAARDAADAWIREHGAAHGIALPTKGE
jgi:hypothetical protein